MVVPSNGILRDAQTGSIVPSPFLDGLVAILIIYFISVGLVYGKTVGTIKSANEIPAKMAEAIAPLTGYIVLVFVIAQFIAIFNYTNLGMVIAVNGAKMLKSAGLTGIPLIISMILMTTFVNLFMSSGSAKWYIFAPIFVPMFMMLGYSPAFAQVVYRIGDSATNPITPIYAYMPIIIGMAQKYDKNVGMGTIISLMLPYTIAFLCVWILQMIAWIVFNIPLGPGAALFLN
jgi:aminobenzoyl-glutamate transport protein